MFGKLWYVDPKRDGLGGYLDIKMLSYQCKNPYANDKTVSWPSYFLQDIPISGMTPGSFIILFVSLSAIRLLINTRV